MEIERERWEEIGLQKTSRHSVAEFAVVGTESLAGGDTSQGGKVSRNGVTVDAVMDGHSFLPRRVAIGAVMDVP
ncbi:hypothetical protein [Sphingobacterium daejeonense]|uniref:hypothetical protein n=1 Tax=Sphingobacterium daejeonense TaxID=371142 RepID=UPI0010C54C4E|nr:hypothetical protein [Sphingobacterium daejeonense]VTP90997.1 Uncharacterised protein [Sphingobacterium daejeonense]